MKINKIVLSTAVAAIISTNVLAEETEIDTVNVWETEISSSSLGITGSAIETKQALHLSDLLRSFPGVDVGGTHSINNRINIRGLQDENLDITIDGAQVQNANMFHHIGNLLINPDLLKKVEINAGTNSVVNGSLGGSVAFQTKDGEDLLENGENFGGRIQGSYNSNDSISGSIAGYGKVGQSGDFLLYHNQVNKNNWEDGRGVKAFGVEGDVQNTLIKYGHKLNDSNKIIITYDRLKDEGDYSPRPDFGIAYTKARTGDYTFPTEYTRDTITLKHEFRIDKTTIDTTLFSNTNELDRYEYLGGVAVRPGGLTEGALNGKVKTVGFNTKAQSNINTGNILNTLTYGALYNKQTSKVTWDGEKYGDDESAKTMAIFIEDALDFDNGLVVTPGIRYNYYDFDGAYGKIKDNKFTYGLAAEYAANEELTLLANATTLYKGVEMVDVLATNRIFVADNTDLKAETGINKEIGLRYMTSNVLGADDIAFSFKYFNTTIKDYINASFNAMTNMGELDIKGFETSFLYKKGNFESLLTYSRTETEFQETGLANETDPGDNYSLNLNYDILSNLSISTESMFVRAENDLAGDEYNNKESYNVHDLAVNWKPSQVKGLTVIAGIDNIFDEEYISHISENRTFALSGIDYSTADYEAGRNIKITLAYKF